MGIRFRKSFGNHFRINISKSGIGYSLGMKGIRVTRTATGGNRATLSIPGTGISYVKESGRGVNTRQEPIVINQPAFVNEDDDKYIASDRQGFVQSIEQYVKQTISSSVFLIVSIIFLFPVGLLMLPFAIMKKKKVAASKPKADYEIDTGVLDNHKKIVATFNAIANSSVVYELEQYDEIQRRIITKHIHGFGTSVDYLDVNTEIVVINLDRKRSIVILPDIILLKQGSEFSAITSGQLKINIMPLEYIDNEQSPTDSEILGQRWLHCNQDGSQDRRFNVNYMINVYKYALVTFTHTDSNFRLGLLASNFGKISQVVSNE